VSWGPRGTRWLLVLYVVVPLLVLTTLFVLAAVAW
jgi:hypothetical protein